MASPITGRATQVPRTVWVGLAAAVVYLLFAAVLGNVLGDAARGDTAEFALSHFIPLPIAIVLGLLFVFRWSGWDPRRVFSETPTPRLAPRRLWLVLIPVLVVALTLVQVPGIPWGDRTVGFVVMVVLGTLLIGIGEELFIRGILLESLRARHGELLVLVVTSVVFALAHVLGSVWAGVPAAAIALQVAFLAVSGSSYYWVRRVTGRLWVAMLVHAFDDCVLYLASGDARPTDALVNGGNTSAAPQWLLFVLQFALIVLAVAGVISAAREDRRIRRSRREPTRPTQGA